MLVAVGSMQDLRMPAADLGSVMVEQRTRLFRRAYRMLGDRQSAEDLAQETWIRAHLGLSSFRGGSFLAWLERILRNACIDEIRRSERHAWISLEATDPDGDGPELGEQLPDAGASVEEAIERLELSERLRSGLDSLPRDQRTAVALIDVYDLNYREAAHVLRVPVGTVKSRVSRARATLRRRLREQDAVTPDLPDRSRSPAGLGLSGDGKREPSLAL